MANVDPIKFRFRLYSVIFLFAMVIGTIGFMFFENLSFSDSLYFSIVTVATVGYGDIHPVTSGGRLCAVILIVMGVGTFLGVIANATDMMLNRHEKQNLLKKVNIIVGVFYSEVGNRLLSIFSKYDSDIHEALKNFKSNSNMTTKNFQSYTTSFKLLTFRVEVKEIDFNALKQLLINKRLFMVGLLENPILVENEEFTDVLRAVFHLTEELDARSGFDKLPETDLQHLTGDVNRAYKMLALQWIDYLDYLKTFYPYLFSLAIRMNPFNESSSPIVHET